MAIRRSDVTTALRRAVPTLALSGIALATLLLLVRGGVRPRDALPAAYAKETPTVSAARERKLTLLDQRALGGVTASGLVPLGGKRVVVVDDDKGVVVVDDQSARVAHAPAGAFSDLEGICRGREPRELLVISERTGAVHALRLREDGKDVAADAPKLVGTVAPISEADNKGFEGIAVWVAKGARPARVVVVNEGKPRRVLLLSTSTLALEATLPLPDGVKDELEDLSDVVVTPAGDELLILSQKSRRLAWFRVDGDKLVATATATLSIDKKEKPEAVAFDDDGTLLIGTDKSGKLYRFRVEP